MPSPLFFIAVLPNATIQQEITEFKETCSKLFQASHALNAPPHITLVSPFRWPENRLGEIKTTVGGCAENKQPFFIQLHGFSSFPPRVLFVDVLPNEPLTALKDDLDRRLAENPGWKTKPYPQFRPHLTIAHRDLDESVFPRALAFFSEKEYQRTFRAESLTIFRHTGKIWEAQEHFSLTGNL